MMRFLLMVGLVVVALNVTSQAEEQAPPKSSAKHPALEQIKKWAGEWVEQDANGKPTDKVVSVIKVTAAGTAVQETLFPGTDQEMITIYHLDGKDLLLTHFCALGNQPQLKLDPKSTTKELKFNFVGGTNLDPKKDMHMHEGSVKIIDDDHLEWCFQGWNEGKPAEGHQCAIKVVRKKK
jgi:hypothetical protein